MFKLRTEVLRMICKLSVPYTLPLVFPHCVSKLQRYRVVRTICLLRVHFCSTSAGYQKVSETQVFILCNFSCKLRDDNTVLNSMMVKTLVKVKDV